MKNLPKPIISKKGKPAELTKKGYMQLYDLGVKVKKDYLNRMDVVSFRKASIKTFASARTRCTDSASGFLEGLQSIGEPNELTGDKQEADEGTDQVEGDEVDEGSVFINKHSIETQKRKTNYLFAASRACLGIYENSYKKGVNIPSKIWKSLDNFLSNLETKYGFYIEHYVKNPSRVNYLRLFTIEEYFHYIATENNIHFLSKQDLIWLEALSSYIKIQWYSSGDPTFLRTINHELLSKISFNLDSRNIWEANYKQKSFDMVVYSGHDSSLLFLFMGLGLTSLKCLESLILQAESEIAVSDAHLRSCLHFVDLADDFRIELAERNGKAQVVLRKNNVYYKIGNPGGWTSPTVCGKKSAV